MSAKEPKKTTSAKNADDRQEVIQRNVLPIPDVAPPGLTTFDAKDPDTHYPPIRQLRPPQSAPNVPVDEDE